MSHYPRADKRNHRRSQKGVYAIAFSAILGAVAIAVLAFSAITAKKAVFHANDSMKKDIELAIEDLQAWYEREADTLALTRQTPSEAQLQAVLRRPYPGLRVEMSSSMAAASCTSTSASSQCIPWRKIAVWYPGATPPTTRIVVDGLPVTDLERAAIWRVYSSQAWYIARYAQSRKKMDEIGQALMGWFAVQQSLDTDRANAVNFWRAADCALPGGRLPCLDSYTSLESTSVPATLGLSAADITAHLGSAVEMSNLQDSSNSSPYSISLRVVAPWGAQITQRVIQP